MGREEIDIIMPAIAQLRERGIDAIGPLPADTMFHEDVRSLYHAALTMYHDQGLIPFKLLSFGTGVNFTAGLPIVRTSPDHGTAYDIAGKNKASGDSMRKAMFLAKDLMTNRKQFLEDSKDPIKKAPKPQEEIQE